MPSRKCSYHMKDVGRCQQRAVGELCSFHERWRDSDREPDRTYHEKIVRGLLKPTFDYLTDEEANTLFYGRKRQDGRRMDAWALNDPLEWHGEAA